MRLLIDECLSTRLRDMLANAGHDAVHLGDLDLLGAPDERVMTAAVEDDRVLVSADTDFGELLATSSASLPSVVLLRRSDRRPESQADVLIANLPAVEADLAAGAIIVILSDRLRIRRLPIAGVD